MLDKTCTCVPTSQQGEPILAQAGDDDGHLSDLLTPPRVRTDLEEPKTPDMPELSSITQDICKVCKIVFNHVTPVLRLTVDPDPYFYVAASVPGSVEEGGHDGRTAKHPHRQDVKIKKNLWMIVTLFCPDLVEPNFCSLFSVFLRKRFAWCQTASSRVSPTT